MSELRKRELSALSNSREASYIVSVESALQRLINSCKDEASLSGLNLVAESEQLIPDDSVSDFLLYLLRKESSAGHLAVNHGIMISGKPRKNFKF